MLHVVNVQLLSVLGIVAVSCANVADGEGVMES